MYIQLTLNNNINYILIEKKRVKYIIIFTKTNFLKYKISNKLSIYFNKGCKAMELRMSFLCNTLQETEKLINIHNFSLINYFVKKINFTGKSYKIKKKTVFIFEFNKSHIEIVL